MVSQLNGTPMDANQKLAMEGGGELIQQGVFQRVIGKFIYLPHIQHDFSYYFSD